MEPNTTDLAHKTILVHKENEEGALIIDALTGQIKQPINERPDWSEGLTCALLAERLKFYTDRLGSERFTGSLQFPQAIAFEDLGWIAVSEDGNEVELEADTEHRMEFLAGMLGLDREEGGHVAGHAEKVLAEVEISKDTHRTADEAKAFEDAQVQGFDQKTGTNND